MQGNNDCFPFIFSLPLFFPPSLLVFVLIGHCPRGLGTEQWLSEEQSPPCPWPLLPTQACLRESEGSDYQVTKAFAEKRVVFESDNRSPIECMSSTGCRRCPQLPPLACVLWAEHQPPQRALAIKNVSWVVVTYNHSLTYVGR